MSAEHGEPSPENTVFALHDSFESVTEAGFTQKIPYTVYFEDSVRGLSPGAPVEFRGMRVGTVKDVRLQIDAADDRIRIPVEIEIEPERIEFEGAVEDAPYKVMEALVERGLRAQLQSANMLTGHLLVDLGFHPNLPSAKLVHKGRYPEIPSVPSELQALTASVTGVLTELASLPLGELVQDLRDTVQALNRLASSPKAEETLEAVSVSAAALQSLLSSLDQQMGPLIREARGTLASADALVGSESPMRYDLNAMLKELTGAARSIRVFADYLERHPDALLRGKSGFANQ
jgi:paraquat-inducible protein B